MEDKKILPRDVAAVFEEKGLFEKDVLFFVKTDLDLDFHYTDVFCVATADTLAVLSGKRNIQKYTLRTAETNGLTLCEDCGGAVRSHVKGVTYGIPSIH